MLVASGGSEDYPRTSSHLPTQRPHPDSQWPCRPYRTHPAACLASLSNEELRKLCSALPGVPVSGNKAVRIRRIIGYFANLITKITKEVSDEASPGERFYRTCRNSPRRDRENLLSNQIIKKDHDIDNGFEPATRFLFESKQGLKLIERPATRCPVPSQKPRHPATVCSHTQLAESSAGRSRSRSRPSCPHGRGSQYRGGDADSTRDRPARAVPSFQAMACCSKRDCRTLTSGCLCGGPVQRSRPASSSLPSKSKISFQCGFQL